MKKALPVRGVVGYVEDPDETTDDGAYYLTQYALAPLIVDHSPNHPLVVGNFSKLSGAPPPVKLRVLKDFGNGVFLFAGEGQ